MFFPDITLKNKAFVTGPGLPSTPIKPRSHPRIDGVPPLLGVKGHQLAFALLWIQDVPNLWPQTVISMNARKFFCHFLTFSLPVCQLQKKRRQIQWLPYTDIRQNEWLYLFLLEEWFQNFCSNLFTVPKASGSICLILNLKISKQISLCTKIMYGINKIYKIRHCIAETRVISGISRQTPLQHLDIFMHPHIPLTSMLLGDQHFQFVALPFWLSSAPWVFTKVLAALPGISEDPGHSYHRLPRWSLAEGLLRHNLLDQHPIDDSISFNF